MSISHSIISVRWFSCHGIISFALMGFYCLVRAYLQPIFWFIFIFFSSVVLIIHICCPSNLDGSMIKNILCNYTM